MSCHSNRIVRVTYPKNCCPEVDDSQQLIYPGPALPCIDVQTNQTFNDAVKELDTLLCNAIQELFECKQICLSFFVEANSYTVTIQSTGVVNGKPAYENIPVGDFGDEISVKWSNTNNEWEFYINGDFGYTLDSECYFPISDVNEWVCAGDVEFCLRVIGVSTYEGVCTTTTTTTVVPVPLCLTMDYVGEVVGVQNSYYSYAPFNISVVNGQFAYEYSTDFGPLVIFWNSDSERWEARTSVSSPNLYAYLNLPYTPPNIPVPDGLCVTSVLPELEGWVILNEAVDVIIYSTRLGNCCGCFFIQYPTAGSYSGTYINCNGDEMEWQIPEIIENVSGRGICTSSPQTVTWNEIPNGFSYIPGDESCVCESTSFGDFCGCVLCIEFPGSESFGGPFFYTAPQAGIINEIPWFTFGTSSCIKYNNALSRWEIYADCNNPGSLYAYSTINGYLLPLGDIWDCAPGAECEKGLGLPIITLGACQITTTTTTTLP